MVGFRRYLISWLIRKLGQVGTECFPVSMTDSIVVLSCLNGVVSEIAFAPCLSERRRWESGVKAEDSRFCCFALQFFYF